VDVPASIIFDASRSFDPKGRPLTARWDFGDGSPVTEADAGAPVSHAYTAPGNYPVTLVVSTDGQESTAVTTAAEVLPPLAPAMAVVPACGRPGDRITATVGGHRLVSPAGGWNLGRAPLPAVRSVYPDDKVRVSFAGPAGGDLADQSATIEEYSTDLPLEFSTRFSFAVGATWAPGTYTVSTPDDGDVSGGFTVPCPSLANEPPHANAGGPYQGTVGLPVVLDGRLSDDPEGAPLTFHWFFEDGGTASGPQPSYTFVAPGTYYALLVVNDGLLDSPTSVGTGSYTTVEITAPPETTTTSTMAATTSTTSTTNPSTPRTSTTATTTSSTTTTTTMPPRDLCTNEPPRPAFRSITCRIIALMAQTEAESALGNLRGKLVPKLAKAKDRTELADTWCAQGQRKKPASRLKQVRRRLIGYAHQLRGLAARKAVPADIREPLARTAEAIQTDGETLRKTLRCPDDAKRP
jgi:PKD repeat protein